jgi:phosphopantothenoylcysteine decarboxylase/phosphopantothenate--cysteine ligase
MAHIDWARQADVVLIAPATANTLAKLAHGIGDDMLTTLVLASTSPLVVAPAMNPAMYTHDATQAALKALSARATTIVEPDEGDVACGEKGQGKLASIAKIVASVMEVASISKKLEGKTVLITSGPTQEPIDHVRFLSNRSSGKMGAALARAALLMGAKRVVVVSGPVSIGYPLGTEVVRVRTAEEMLAASLTFASEADLIIGAAAVADYRPANPFVGKVRRSSEPLDLELVPNPDVIASLAAHAPQARVVGFAAEPSTDLGVAHEKIVRKGLFAIAANDISQTETGFEADDNALTLITGAGERESSGRLSKLSCALWLLQRLANDN